MNGIRLKFGVAGPSFDFSRPVKEFDSTVQNALVNVGTRRGSDPVFSERGTDLQIDGAQGRMATMIWATQSANFAALRTLAFAQKNEVESNSWQLQTFTLRCERVVLDKVTLAVQAVSTDGLVVGGLATL